MRGAPLPQLEQTHQDTMTLVAPKTRGGLFRRSGVSPKFCSEFLIYETAVGCATFLLEDR